MNSDDVAGPAFPFAIDPATGGVAWSFGQDKIRQNVHLILGTRVGERPMLRHFGSRLSAMVHEPNNAVLGDLLARNAQEALVQWEPRVLAFEAGVEQSGAQATLRIRYALSDQAESDVLNVPIV
jgi:uncharacterized protein